MRKHNILTPTVLHDSPFSCLFFVELGRIKYRDSYIRIYIRYRGRLTLLATSIHIYTVNETACCQRPEAMWWWIPIVCIEIQLNQKTRLAQLFLILKTVHDTQITYLPTYFIFYSMVKYKINLTLGN